MPPLWNTFLEKRKPLKKKLEYWFLVESPKIENATFPHKTDLSEANVMTKRTGSTKWTYHKEQGFTSNYFTFLNIWRTSNKELRWCANYPNVHIHTFHKRWIIFESAFSLWLSLKLLQIYQSAKTFLFNICQKNRLYFQTHLHQVCHLRIAQ